MDIINTKITPTGSYSYKEINEAPIKNKSEWWKYGWHRGTNGINHPPSGTGKEVEEWNAGTVDGLRQRGFEESINPIKYDTHLVDTNGTSLVNISERYPIVIYPKTEYRKSWDESARKKAIEIGLSADSHEFRGFISAFETGVDPPTRLEDIKKWNVGAVLGYKHLRGETVSKKDIKKEQVNMGVTATKAVESTTTFQVVKQVAKTDMAIMAKRAGARKAVKLTKDFLVNKFTEGMTGEKKSSTKTAIAAALDTPIGEALIGITLSLGIPKAAEMFGKGDNPHVLEFAHECRLESGTDVFTMLFEMLQEGGGELMNIIKSATSEPDYNLPVLQEKPVTLSDIGVVQEAELVGAKK